MIDMIKGCHKDYGKSERAELRSMISPPYAEDSMAHLTVATTARHIS